MERGELLEKALAKYGIPLEVSEEMIDITASFSDQEVIYMVEDCSLHDNPHMTWKQKFFASVLFSLVSTEYPEE